MRETDYLNPNHMRKEILQLGKKLKAYEIILNKTYKTITGYMEEMDMDAKTIRNEKERLNCYCSIASEMSAAGYEDAEEYMELYNRLEMRVLDGEVILSEMNRALKDEKINMEMAAEMERLKKQSLFGYPPLDINNYLYYEYMEFMYLEMAAESKKRYEDYRRQEQMYDEVEMQTKDFFIDRKQVRDILQKALSDLSGENICVEGNAAVQGWQEELRQYHRKKFYAVNAERKETVNWSNVDKIIKKPSAAISDTEYELLAECYLAADGEGMTCIVRGMMQRDEENFRYWEMNDKKWVKLATEVQEAYAKELQKLLTGAGDDSGSENLEKILQRLTLLFCITDVDVYVGNEYGTEPRINVVPMENGTIEIRFTDVMKVRVMERPEDRIDEGIIQRVNCKQKDFYRSGVFTISRTESRGYIDKICKEKSETRFEMVFGKFSLGESMQKSLVGEVLDMLTDAMGPVGTGINIAGSVGQDATEKYKNKVFIHKEFDKAKMSEIIDDFGFYANFVEDSRTGDYFILPYVGENTQLRIYVFNKAFAEKYHIREKWGTELTTEFLLENPEQVWEVVMEIEQNGGLELYHGVTHLNINNVKNPFSEFGMNHTEMSWQERKE